MKLYSKFSLLILLVVLVLPQQSIFAASYKNKATKKAKSSHCLGRNYKTFAKRSSKYDKIIKKYSLKYGVSSALIKSVITAESCFNSRAVSPKGAQGLMQLMPATARRFGVKDRFNTDLNIKAGTRYLKFLLKYFKDDLLNAIAAYNAGEGAVKKYKGIPPYKETRHYVSKVSELYRYFSRGGGELAYAALSGGKFSKTFFTPRSMPVSRYSPYKNHRRNISRGQCTKRTSTRLRKSTKVQSGQGIWQRIYVSRKGDNLSTVMQRTGVHKTKLMQMNGLSSRTRLKAGQKLLVWECRK